MLDPMLLEILACPKCKGPLVYDPEAGTLTSWQSMLRYRIEDDIPIMLIEEAQTLTTDDLAGHLLGKLPAKSSAGRSARSLMPQRCARFWRSTGRRSAWRPPSGSSVRTRSWTSSPRAFARRHRPLFARSVLARRLTMKLEDKVAIVTGCAHGIGEATAVLFAQEGAKVCGSDVLDEDGQATIDEIKASGGQAVYCHGDVAVDADCKAMVDCAVDNFSGLDILINNAGIANLKPITDMSEEEWDRLIDINLKSCYLMSRHAIPHIKERGGGAIVNIALGPRHGDPGQLHGLRGQQGRCDRLHA